MVNLAKKFATLEQDLLLRLEEKNVEISELRAREQVLAQRCAELEHQLAGIAASRSWRITAKLRRVAELRRQVWPLFRRGKVALQLKDLKLKDLKLRNQDGLDSQQTSYELLPQAGKLLPGGWVAFDYELKTQRPHQAFFLYYDAGSGFAGDARVLLTLERGRGRRFFKISDQCRRLRLDPFDSNLEFSAQRLSLRPLGTAQVIWLWLSEQFRQDQSLASFYRKLKKAVAVLRRGGVAGLRARLGDSTVGHDYQKWVATYDTLSARDLEQMRAHVFEYAPLISILMPTYNTPVWALEKAIESVLAQTYQNWELCIADDCSSDVATWTCIERYAAKDQRIKCVRRSTNGHISAASNSSLELAQGEYVALLDHDDELTADALFQMVAVLNRQPEVELLYSDEDKITEEGLRHNPYFKSDWNPELLLSQNYICHFTVIKTQVVRAVGGFREGFEGAQDWDLILRVGEQVGAAKVVHIPHVLYHWRAMRGSTAAGTLHKPYVMQAQKRAVEEHLLRTGQSAKVTILEDISQLRVNYVLPQTVPAVALIIPTKDQVGVLRTCVRSILEKTNYPNFSVVIVDNRSDQAETFEYFDFINRDPRVRVVRDERPFNFSALNNGAVAQLDREFELLGFVNNDIEVISEHWLAELVGSLTRTEVAAVGARLYYPNGLLQHGGVVLGIGGVAGHSHKGRPRSDVGYFNRIVLPHNVSAVTAACMLVKRAAFEQVGGFDEGTLAVAFNDVDLCLRLRSLGYYIVYNPYAELYHHESVSRGYETTPEKFARFESEIAVMQERWGHVLAADPFYNPNLTVASEDFGLAYPPRVEKCWRSLTVSSTS